MPIASEPIKLERNSLGDLIFGSAGTLPGRHPLGNAPSNFLSIDLGMYLDEPYVLARRDGTGRQSYPHQLLKSSLFSTGNRAMDLELSYRFNSVIASGLGILLLGMFFVSLFRLATSRPAELARHLPLLVFGSVLLSAHLLFRISEAVGHHGDFRHVYPVLVAAIPLFMAPVDRWVRHGRAAGFVGYFWVVSFIFGSGLYFTPKQALVDSVQLEPRRFEVPLDQLSMTKKKGTDWNHVDNIFIPRDAYLAIPMPQQRVDEIEFTVDWNDTYEVKILGPNRAHVTVVRPPKPRIKGLMFHRMKIHPPMPGAHEIQIRHVSGDNRYIVGHFVVNPGPSEPVGRVERR